MRNDYPVNRLFTKPRRDFSQGLTLVEVLIAMFVLVVGLSGIAALIPIGTFRLEKGTIEERKVAVGMAALATLEADKIGHPLRWMDLNGVPFDAIGADGRQILRGVSTGSTNSVTAYLPSTAGHYSGCLIQFTSGKLRGRRSRIGGHTVSGDTSIFALSTTLSTTLPAAPSFGDGFVVIRHEAFAIDPLYIAHNPGVANLGKFPIEDFATSDSRIRRISVSPYSGQTGRMLKPLAKAVFQGVDDLALDSLSDLDNDPLQYWIEKGTTRIKRGTNENYSWLATLVPFSVDDTQRYAASVVVFYKRNFKAGTGDLNRRERTVSIEFTGLGYGGGEARLYTANTVDPAYLDVRVGQWIMAAGPRMSRSWYRIASVRPEFKTGTVNSVSANFRNVTLVGPDWAPSDPSDPLTTDTAAIFPDAVGVFERTITIRED